MWQPFAWSRAELVSLGREEEISLPRLNPAHSLPPSPGHYIYPVVQTSRQEGPQVWPHYLFLLPGDILQLHLVNQSLLADGKERREDTHCPYQSSFPSLSVWPGLETTRSAFGQGTTQKYCLVLLTFLCENGLILRQHFSNSQV